MKISELPDDLRVLALSESEKQPDWTIKFRNLDDLYFSFNWETSVQGTEFWIFVARKNFDEARALLNPKP